MVGCGLPLPDDGAWKESQLLERLQRLIEDHGEHFAR